MAIPASFAALADCKWKLFDDKFRNSGSDVMLPVRNDGRDGFPVLCMILLEPLTYVEFHPSPPPNGSFPNWYMMLLRIRTCRPGSPPLIVKLPLLENEPQSYSVLL